MCKKYNRLLEQFCRTEQTCVCQVCSETDHKSHDIVPLEEECAQRRIRLRETVCEMIRERFQKVKDINISVELNKRNTEKEVSDKVQVFNALVHSIEKCKAQLVGVVKQKQEAVERQAKGLIEELEK
ncbi:hypothetical protein DPEC_G00175920 [Dallia pectoralis]|uniref:Uncharacterized protein n=1 Tax=Dallia pectoralis TaxID=75939 RepID=A0ACC2GEH4_DALPE|nr:hypothetical protein DPEC_G00175920 [Dallia pectoralis]